MPYEPSLKLPELQDSYYWHVVVRPGPEVQVQIYLKRKVLGLFTYAIENCGRDFVIIGGYDYKGPLVQEVASRAQKIYDGRFNQDEAIKALRDAFPEAKVTKS